MTACLGTLDDEYVGAGARRLLRFVSVRHRDPDLASDYPKPLDRRARWDAEGKGRDRHRIVRKHPDLRLERVVVEARLTRLRTERRDVVPVNRWVRGRPRDDKEVDSERPRRQRARLLDLVGQSVCAEIAGADEAESAGGRYGGRQLGRGWAAGERRQHDRNLEVV